MQINRWQLWELEILRREYIVKSVEEVQELLPHRSILAIRSRASLLGIKAQSGRLDLPWRDWEKDIIKNIYPTEGAEGVQKHLAERRLNAIKVEAFYLKVKKGKTLRKARNINMTTGERNSYIIANIGTKTPEELAQEFGVSVKAIANICMRVGGVNLVKRKKEARVKYILDNIGTKTPKELAQGLSVPVSTIYNIRSREGNSVNQSKEERDTYILDNIDTMSLDELAKQFDITVNTILNICARKGSVDLYKRKNVEWKNSKRK